MTWTCTARFPSPWRLTQTSGAWSRRIGKPIAWRPARVNRARLPWLTNPRPAIAADWLPRSNSAVIPLGHGRRRRSANDDGRRERGLGAGRPGGAHALPDGGGSDPARAEGPAVRLQRRLSRFPAGERASLAR